MAVMFALCVAGCDEGQVTETTMFESAEVEFRHGNYEDALEGYQAFLQQYPQSPLASTAEMRIRSINREVASVMERTGMPRPSYHGSDTQRSASTAGDVESAKRDTPRGDSSPE